MPAYDATRFDPPAPVALVQLRDPASGANRADVPMLLDFGDDITLLPSAAVAQLGLAPDPGAGYQLVGFDGSTSTGFAVRLEMHRKLVDPMPRPR